MSCFSGYHLHWLSGLRYGDKGMSDIEIIEKKVDEIIVLLKDENIGALKRMKNLECSVYGHNGKIGLFEEIRGLKKETAKTSVTITAGTTLVLQAVAIYIRHKLGW